MRDEINKWLSSDNREASKAKETIRSITQEVLIYKPTVAKIRRIEFTGQILGANDGGERGS
jgi:polyribonucleotide nucleotidyltransferase